MDGSNKIIKQKNFVLNMDIAKAKLLKVCRICREEPKSAVNLFDRCQRKLVRQIEEIIGAKLKCDKRLPNAICQICQKDTEQAYLFRLRCLQAQEYYASAQEYDDHKTPTTPIVHSKICANTLESRLDINERIPVVHEEEHVGTEMPNYKVKLEGSNQEHCMTANYENPPKIAAHTSEPSLKTEQLSTADLLPKEQKRPEELPPSMSDGAKPERPLEPTKTKKNALSKNCFICDQCGNQFTCRHHFVTHLRRHVGDKQFQCELCPFKFFTHSELKRHMRRHTGERPFACRHCDRRFTDYSSRIKHERTHTNERPFTCIHCGKAFTTTYILKNHMLIHTGQRAFKCNLCGKSFQRDSHLVVHYRSLMHKQNEEKLSKAKSDGTGKQATNSNPK